MHNNCKHDNTTPTTGLCIGDPSKPGKVAVWKICTCKDCGHSTLKKYEGTITDLKEVVDSTDNVSMTDLTEFGDSTTSSIVESDNLDSLDSTI